MTKDRWTVTTAVALHAAVFITSCTMWAKWQHQLGNGGSVRGTDNTFSPTRQYRQA